MSPEVMKTLANFSDTQYIVCFSCRTVLRGRMPCGLFGQGESVVPGDPRKLFSLLPTR